MLKYNYCVKSTPDKIINGVIEAESEQDAVSKLAKLGYFPFSVKQVDAEVLNKSLFGARKLSEKDKVIFSSQLSTLVDSGVDIIKAVNIISEQTSNLSLRSILKDVTERIKNGASLSESLAAYPQVFPLLYTALIHTGEVSGNISDVLKKLAEFYEKEEEFRNSLLASLTYPAIVICVSAMTVAVLLIFVIPRLVLMFEDMGQVLPLPTRVLISVSLFFRDYWWVFAGIALGFFIILRRMYRNPQGRLIWDEAVLKLPALGVIVLKSELSCLTRTLSLLLSSGIPITDALDKSSAVVNNRILKQEVQRLKGQINSGTNFSDSLKSSRFFPVFITSIVTIGEETGTLYKSLKRVAEDYERDVDRILKTVIRLLEPAIILIMGLIVGFIVVSMLLPIFQINLIVK